jgi:hypothetical protein
MTRGKDKVAVRLRSCVYTARSHDVVAGRPLSQVAAFEDPANTALCLKTTKTTNEVKRLKATRGGSFTSQKWFVRYERPKGASGARL